LKVVINGLTPAEATIVALEFMIGHNSRPDCVRARLPNSQPARLF